MYLTFRYTLLFIAFVFTSIQLHSQVTIGSGIPPMNGCLLDIKETDIKNGANSKKGIMLPRVNLTQKNSLIDISDVDFANTTEQQAHTGLTVFNINPTFDKGTGLHFWDGKEWLNIKPDTIVETRIERDTVTVIKNVDKIYFSGMANDANSLLNLAIAGTAWKTVAFQTGPIDSKSSYNSATGIFKVNATGTFNIYARYIYSGVSLFQTVGITIYKKPAGQSTFTLLFKDEVNITIGLTGGVRLINQLNVSLNAGDELVFGLQTGGVNLSVATGGASVSATIKQN